MIPTVWPILTSWILIKWPHQGTYISNKMHPRDLFKLFWRVDNAGLFLFSDQEGRHVDPFSPQTKGSNWCPLPAKISRVCNHTVMSVRIKAQKVFTLWGQFRSKHRKQMALWCQCRLDNCNITRISLGSFLLSNTHLPNQRTVLHIYFLPHHSVCQLPISCTVNITTDKTSRVRPGKCRRRHLDCSHSNTARYYATIQSNIKRLEGAMTNVSEMKGALSAIIPAVVVFAKWIMDMQIWVEVWPSVRRVSCRAVQPLHREQFLMQGWELRAGIRLFECCQDVHVPSTEYLHNQHFLCQFDSQILLILVGVALRKLYLQRSLDAVVEPLYDQRVLDARPPWNSTGAHGLMRQNTSCLHSTIHTEKNNEQRDVVSCSPCASLNPA